MIAVSGRLATCTSSGTPLGSLSAWAGLLDAGRELSREPPNTSGDTCSINAPALAAAECKRALHAWPHRGPFPGHPWAGTFRALTNDASYRPALLRERLVEAAPQQARGYTSESFASEETDGLRQLARGWRTLSLATSNPACAGTGSKHDSSGTPATPHISATVSVSTGAALASSKGSNSHAVSPHVAAEESISTKAVLSDQLVELTCTLLDQNRAVTALAGKAGATQARSAAALADIITAAAAYYEGASPPSDLTRSLVAASLAVAKTAPWPAAAQILQGLTQMGTVGTRYLERTLERIRNIPIAPSDTVSGRGGSSRRRLHAFDWLEMDIGRAAAPFADASQHGFEPGPSALEAVSLLRSLCCLHAVKGNAKRNAPPAMRNLMDYLQQPLLEALPNPAAVLPLLQAVASCGWDFGTDPSLMLRIGTYLSSTAIHSEEAGAAAGPSSPAMAPGSSGSGAAFGAAGASQWSEEDALIRGPRLMALTPAQMVNVLEYFRRAQVHHSDLMERALDAVDRCLPAFTASQATRVAECCARFMHHRPALMRRLGLYVGAHLMPGTVAPTDVASMVVSLARCRVADARFFEAVSVYAEEHTLAWLERAVRETGAWEPAAVAAGGNVAEASLAGALGLGGRAGADQLIGGEAGGTEPAGEEMVNGCGLDGLVRPLANDGVANFAASEEVCVAASNAVRQPFGDGTLGWAEAASREDQQQLGWRQLGGSKGHAEVQAVQAVLWEGDCRDALGAVPEQQQQQPLTGLPATADGVQELEALFAGPASPPPAPQEALLSAVQVVGGRHDSATASVPTGSAAATAVAPSGSDLSHLAPGTQGQGAGIGGAATEAAGANLTGCLPVPELPAASVTGAAALGSDSDGRVHPTEVQAPGVAGPGAADGPPKLKSYQLATTISLEAIAAGRDQRTAVYIARVPRNIEPRQLLEALQTVPGAVLDMFYMPYKYDEVSSGTPGGGFAFVSVVDPESVAALCKRLRAGPLPGLKKKLSVEYTLAPNTSVLLHTLLQLRHSHKAYIHRSGAPRARPVLLYATGSLRGQVQPLDPGDVTMFEWAPPTRRAGASPATADAPRLAGQEQQQQQVAQGAPPPGSPGQLATAPLCREGSAVAVEHGTEQASQATEGLPLLILSRTFSASSSGANALALSVASGASNEAPTPNQMPDHASVTQLPSTGAAPIDPESTISCEPDLSAPARASARESEPAAALATHTPVESPTARLQLLTPSQIALMAHSMAAVSYHHPRFLDAVTRLIQALVVRPVRRNPALAAALLVQPIEDAQGFPRVPAVPAGEAVGVDCGGGSGSTPLPSIKSVLHVLHAITSRPDPDPAAFHDLAGVCAAAIRGWLPTPSTVSQPASSAGMSLAGGATGAARAASRVQTHRSATGEVVAAEEAEGPVAPRRPASNDQQAKPSSGTEGLLTSPHRGRTEAIMAVQVAVVANSASVGGPASGVPDAAAFATTAPGAGQPPQQTPVPLPETDVLDIYVKLLAQTLTAAADHGPRFHSPELCSAAAALLSRHLSCMRPRAACALLQPLVRFDPAGSRQLVRGVAPLLVQHPERLSAPSLVSLAWACAKTDFRDVRAVVWELAARTIELMQELSTANATQIFWALSMLRPQPTSSLDGAGSGTVVTPSSRGGRTAAAAEASGERVLYNAYEGLMQALLQRHDLTARDLLLVQEGLRRSGAERGASGCGSAAMAAFLQELLDRAGQRIEVKRAGADAGEQVAASGMQLHQQVMGRRILAPEVTRRRLFVPGLPASTPGGRWATLASTPAPPGQAATEVPCQGTQEFEPQTHEEAVNTECAASQVQQGRSAGVGSEEDSNTGLAEAGVGAQQPEPAQVVSPQVGPRSAWAPAPASTGRLVWPEAGCTYATGSFPAADAISRGEDCRAGDNELQGQQGQGAGPEDAAALLIRGLLRQIMTAQQGMALEETGGMLVRLQVPGAVDARTRTLAWA